MRRITAVLAFSTVVLALVVPAAQQKFKVSTASVPVYVTVTDQQRRLVPDLVQDDFEILDNGKLQNVNIAKLRQDLETSRDNIFAAAGITQDLFGPQ